MKCLVALCIAAAIPTASLAADHDARKAILVERPQRQLVLEEMRALLAGTQKIMAALAKEDMVGVAVVARSIGTSMTEKSEDQLRGALPKDFMELGMRVHEDFDRIAMDAESKRDARHTIDQLAETMSQCVACHALYRLRP